MQREKFKKWRRETPKIHRSYGEKRNRNMRYFQEDRNEPHYKDMVGQ